MKKAKFVVAALLTTTAASAFLLQVGGATKPVKAESENKVQAPVKQENKTVQAPTKQENYTIQAALSDFKNKAGFEENFVKIENNSRAQAGQEPVTDDTKLLAGPGDPEEGNGHSWMSKVGDQTGPVTLNADGTVKDSLDDPQAATIGEIRAALPD